MLPDKALWLGGFTMAFFQECWDIVQPDLVELFREFDSDGKIPRSLNATFILSYQRRLKSSEYKTLDSLALFQPPKKLLPKYSQIEFELYYMR